MSDTALSLLYLSKQGYSIADSETDGFWIMMLSTVNMLSGSGAVLAQGGAGGNQSTNNIS